MILEQQLIMSIGVTNNGWELTESMVRNSIGNFNGAPIIYNKDSNFKNYNDLSKYNENTVIGTIVDNVNIVGNNVYADIYLFEKYSHLWKGKFDNWCVQFDTDKEGFLLCSIEVF